MAHSSAWRVSDAVAFEAMRESSATLTARLLEDARREVDNAVDARNELLEIRANTLRVDGFDRKAVEALAARFGDRLRDLEGAS